MNRSAKTPIDLPIVGKLALVGLALLALFAFAVGAPQLVELAHWAGVPGYVAWLTPVVVDGALVAYSVAAAVQRSRREKAGLLWVALTFFTGLSVAAQVVHALAVGSAPTAAALWVAVAIAASLPLAVLVGVEAVITVAVSSPMPRKKPVSARRDEVSESVRPSLPSEASVGQRIRPESRRVDVSEGAVDAGPASPPALRVVRPRASSEAKAERDARIIELTEQGHSSREVSRLLASEGIELSASTVTRVLKAAA